MYVLVTEVSTTIESGADAMFDIVAVITTSLQVASGLE
jgi:hypothetical protein